MNPLMQATANHLAEEQRLARNQSRSSGGNSIAKGDPTADPTDVKVTDPEKATTKESHLAEEDEEDVSGLTRLYRRFRPLVLALLAAVILGWWVSATVLKATRHRW